MAPPVAATLQSVTKDADLLESVLRCNPASRWASVTLRWVSRGRVRAEFRVLAHPSAG